MKTVVESRMIARTRKHEIRIVDDFPCFVEKKKYYFESVKTFTKRTMNYVCGVTRHKVRKEIG